MLVRAACRASSQGVGSGRQGIRTPDLLRVKQPL
jgi:hypothetical protein